MWTAATASHLTLTFSFILNPFVCSSTSTSSSSSFACNFFFFFFFYYIHLLTPLLPKNGWMQPFQSSAHDPNAENNLILQPMDQFSGPTLNLPSSASSLGDYFVHCATVTCVAIGPKTGRLLATASEDRQVNLWPVAKKNCLLSLSSHTSTIEALKFGRKEDILCAGSLSGALKVWDLEVSQILRTFSGHKTGISCIEFHPYGDFFASGSLDSNIKLWDTRKKSCMYAYKAHDNDVRCLGFSPDGRWLASGGDDGIIKIWDLAAGKILAEFNEHLAPVTDLAFHPNELLLTSSSMDGTARFWDLESFTQVRRRLYINMNPNGSQAKRVSEHKKMQKTRTSNMMWCSNHQDQMRWVLKKKENNRSVTSFPAAGFSRSCHV